MKILKIKNQYQKGFGLLEVLISAVIIIIILAALVFVGRAALNNNEYLAERAQAIYLAQEGLEMTRQIRDTNWTDGDADSKWNTLQFDSVSSKFVATGSGDYKLQYQSPISRLGLVSGTETITINQVDYVRAIKVETIASSSELIPNNSTDLKPYALKITSTVTWNYSDVPRTISVSEILTNWRPDF